MQKSKSEMWDIISEKKISQVVAGYKANKVRKINLLKRSKKLSKKVIESRYQEISNEYDNKIQTYLDNVKHDNLVAKRHNAAVKAWATMRSESNHSTTKASKKPVGRKLTMTKVIHKVK